MPSQFSTVLATELDLRDDLLGTISDFYKDAHGVRPSLSRYREMTNLQLEAEIQKLGQEVEAAIEQEHQRDLRAVADFQARIQHTIQSGAGDEATALRWTIQPETFYSAQCIDHFLWSQGILFTDYGRSLATQIQEILDANQMWSDCELDEYLTVQAQYEDAYAGFPDY